MAPHIIVITPGRMPVNSDFYVVLYGTGFAATDVITFNGYPGAYTLATTFVNATELIGYIPAADNFTIGVFSLTSTGAVNALNIEITNDLPESAHPYTKNYTFSYTYSAHAPVIYVTFDIQSYVYQDLADPSHAHDDSVTIVYTVTGNPTTTLTYYGVQLAGLTVAIPSPGPDLATLGNPPLPPTFTISIVTVNPASFCFGFRIVRIDVTLPEVYLLGNRNAEDQSVGTTLRPAAATHPSFFSGQYSEIEPQILPFAFVSSPLGSVTYSYKFVFPNAVSAVTWTVTGTLPPGFSIDSTGLLTGPCPATPFSSVFKLVATDGSGNGAEGKFQLNIFHALTIVDTTAHAGIPLSNGLYQFNRYMFYLDGDLYCTTNSDSSAGYAFAIYKSTDDGYTWTRTNLLDTTTSGTKPGSTRLGKLLYYIMGPVATYTAGAYTGSGYDLSLVEYDIKANTYTTLLALGVYANANPGYDNLIFVRPDGSVVYFVVSVLQGQDPTAHMDQIYMNVAQYVVPVPPALPGWVITLGNQQISTNVPDIVNNMSLTLNSIIMDRLGGLHIIYETFTSTSNLGSFWYVYVNPNNTISGPVLLNVNYFCGIAPGEATYIVNGYVSSDDTEIVYLLQFPLLDYGAGTPGSGTLGNTLYAVAHGKLGSPLYLGPSAVTVWTFELFSCDRNRDYSGLFTWLVPVPILMYAFEGPDGEPNIFYVTFDQFGGAVVSTIWNLKRDENGSWTYRNRYYSVLEPASTVTQVVLPMPVEDITSPTGLLLAFLGGDSLGDSIYILHYPCPCSEAAVVGNVFY